MRIFYLNIFRRTNNSLNKEKNASNSGNGINGASRQEKSAESAPQQNPQG